MNSKACAKCRETKNFNQFPRHSGHKDGVQSSCKDCKAVSDKIYYSQNKEKCRLLQSAYREQNRDSINARKIAYAKENRALILSKKKDYRRNNRGKVNANVMRRNAVKLQATPAWANDFFISEIYDMAILRNKATGLKWAVDHIVPLRSKFVCGLHCEQNLQIITERENASKQNRYWPDMEIAV